MNRENNADGNKRYTLATRAIDLEALIVTGVFVALMVIVACLIEDKRFLFIPLLFLVVSFIAFVSLIFRYVTEPKIAIQADCIGIYLYYRKGKETFIDFDSIIDVLACKSKNSYGGISVYTQDSEYTSIMIKEDKEQVSSQIKNLCSIDNREEYLVKVEIKLK